MADLNLRNVTEELVKGLKMEAARRGTTMREYCVLVLEQSLGIDASAKASEKMNREYVDPEIVVQQPQEVNESKRKCPKGDFCMLKKGMKYCNYCFQAKVGK
jgi:hypothetical protein